MIPQMLEVSFLLICLHKYESSVNLLVTPLKHKWPNYSQKTLQIDKGKGSIWTTDQESDI